MSTTISGRLVEERPKAVRWDPLVDTDPPFWIPKSQVEEITADSIIVSDWWIQRVRAREPTERQLFHRSSRCWICWHYYHHHPQTPRERWGQPPYLVLCDGLSYNTETSKKVARGNFHRPEWRVHVEQVKASMLALPRPRPRDIENDFHDAVPHPDGPCGWCGEEAPYTGECPHCQHYNYQGMDLPEDDS